MSRPQIRASSASPLNSAKLASSDVPLDQFSRSLQHQLQRLQLEYDELKEKLKEKRDEPQVIKMLDKIAFTIGLMLICITQFMWLNAPQHFWIYYSIFMPLLLAYRIIHFVSMKFKYFLFDFCYFSCALTFINIFFLRDSPLFFKVCFILSSGPVALAIVVWQCSFVFHDYDKQTSVYIHFLPAVLYYCLRWETLWASNYQSLEDLSVNDYFISLVAYLCWQVMYFVYTEVVCKDVLDADPELQTSLRWLSTDTKNSMAMSVRAVCRMIGVFGPQETFDAKSIKTKLIFSVTQLLFTVVCLLPSCFIFDSRQLHTFYIVALFVAAVYNGGSYYIEVFAQRYHVVLEQKEQLQRNRRQNSATDLKSLNPATPDNTSNKQE